MSHKAHGVITIVGGGLAGSEAAWQAASRGVPVTLHEMRPVRPTAVHKTDRLAELVCSNSFRGDKLDNAVGLLKEEMRRLGSLVMRAAEASRVPAGAALAVDRERFARDRHRRDRTVIRSSRSSAKRSTSIPESTRARSGDRRDRSADVRRAVGRHRARSSAASICTSTTRSARSCWPRSIDRDEGVPAVAVGSEPPASGVGRYDCRRALRRRSAGPACGVDDGEGDYLNCPMTRDEYERFYDALIARRVGDGPRLRQGEVLRRLPADRGDGASRRRHAAVRADEAGRPRRSAHRPRAVRRRAAAAGQPRRRSLQPGRLPDADQMGRAGARAAADSRPRAGRVRPLRHGAPQHLRQRPDRAAPRRGRCARGRRCSSRARCRASRATSSRRPRGCSPG